MSEARINSISNENNTGGPTISGITTFSGLNFFVPPKGTTAQRPSDCPPGSVRFNTDSAHLEYFDGLQWLELEAFNVELGQAGALGNRGIFGGGFDAPSYRNTIDYVTISTTGNAINFGILSQSRGIFGACSSSTRGVFGGGYVPGIVNTIDFVTISSTGNATDFGDLTQARYGISACSSSTRGVFGGGIGSAPTYATFNTIDYITIASIGNAVDFGDLTQPRGGIAACSSSTRGIFAGGVVPTAENTIDFITISSTGNATDFGDLSQVRGFPAACSSSTRGLFGGGYTPTIVNTIDFITISTLGNASDFGDLSQARSQLGACSSSTRGVFGGGQTPTVVNTIDYVTITSIGNAIDFGDLTIARRYLSALSNGHGGL
jgi:hypothetical protein